MIYQLNKLIPFIAFSVLLLVPIGAQNAFAGVPLTIIDEAICESIPGAVWSTPPDTCTLTSNYTITPGPGWVIAVGVTLVINAGVTLTNDSNISNLGTIDVFGTIDQNNAVITNSGTINIYGTVDNGSSGNIENQGVINIICDAVYTGDPIQINPPNIIPCPSPEPPIVGGENLSIDSSALLLASAQSTSWMIPLVLSVLGIGMFVVSRNRNNDLQ